MANIAIVNRPVSNTDIVRSHIATHGNISTRDAAAFYGMTGGTVTKIISDMRRNSNIVLNKTWLRCAVTGRRYASYHLTYGEVIPCFALAYIA